MRWLRLLFIAAALATSAPVLAVQPDEVLSDPALETRARALSKELRCMVCQNQSIDDSDAPLARDLRVLVRERLQSGDSDAEVLDFLVARYGEFVLLKPRFGGRTALLWLMPAIALLLGVGGLVIAWRRYRRAASAGPTSTGEGTSLSSAEEARLSRILQRGDS
jgi:cytochrome c-type biogenesis protein CcmH